MVRKIRIISKTAGRTLSTSGTHSASSHHCLLIFAVEQLIGLRLHREVKSLWQSRLVPLLLLPVLLLHGCATQFLLHPETARQAVSARPVSPGQLGDHPEVITVTNKF